MDVAKLHLKICDSVFTKVHREHSIEDLSSSCQHVSLMKKRLMVLILLSVLCSTGCDTRKDALNYTSVPETTKPMPGDSYPSGTAVSLNVDDIPGGPVVLGPRSSQLFLSMIAKDSVHSEISSMPAAPLGVFTASTAIYEWHGNAVIRGTGTQERLWHGPFTQRLIVDWTKSDLKDRQSLLRILTAIEEDPNVANTPLEGPGAYPGGGDALHPYIIRLR